MIAIVVGVRTWYSKHTNNQPDESDGMCMGNCYGFIDCEFTSGYRPGLESVELLSLGCVISDEHGQIVAEYYRLIQPTQKKNRKLTKYISELTKITQLEVNSAESWSVFSAEFEAFLVTLPSEVKWWCWGDHDVVGLQQSILVNDYQGPITHIVEQLTDLQPTVVPDLLAKIGITKQQWSLEKCKRLFGLGEKVMHHALSDAVDLCQVYWAFQQKVVDLVLLEQLEAEPSRHKFKKATTKVKVESKLVKTSYQCQFDQQLYGVFKQLWHKSGPELNTEYCWKYQSCYYNSKKIAIQELQTYWCVKACAKTNVIAQVELKIFQTKRQKLVVKHTFVCEANNQKLLNQVVTLLEQQAVINTASVNG